MKKTFYLLAACLAFAYVNTACAEDLLTVYQQAFEADPTLRSAGLKMEIGADQKGQALGEMLPQVSANANWSANNQRQKSPASARTSNYHGTRYTLSLNQTVIDFAKYWNWRRAQEIEDQYALELTEAQHALMSNVVEKYFGVLEAEDQLYFLQTERQATEKQLEQVKKQYAKQMVKVTDLYDTEAELDQIKASEIEAEAILATAKESLKELTNTNVVGLYKLRDNIEYNALEGRLDEWIDVAKNENPSLVAQSHAIEAASNDVAAQKSKYLPVVDAQFNYYDSNTGYQSSNIGQTETQVAAINVSVPIFTGGVTTHRLFEANHRLELSKVESEAKINALIKETSDAYLSANASVRRISASQKTLESTTKARQAKETGFKYGVETMSDVLIAQRAEFRAKKELSKSTYSYIKNRIRFMHATGLISEENLIEVNDWLINLERSDPHKLRKS